MSIGHNSGVTDIESLPNSIRDIAETLGMTIVFKLVEHFAGVELRIPHTLKPDHKLMVLGKDHAEALCAFCPEDTILVPMSLDRKRIARQVKALEGKGLKRWEIARELGITQRHVRRLANSGSVPSNQIDMFS